MAKFIEFWVKVIDEVDGRIYLHPVTIEEVEAVVKGIRVDEPLKIPL